jgi:hypothetical protein
LASVQLLVLAGFVLAAAVGPCPYGHRRSCRPCDHAGRHGRLTRRAGCRRDRCHSPDPGYWSPGRLRVWCSGRWRPAPPHARVQLPQLRCWSGRCRRRGRAQAAPHADQQLAETAKRSIHKASKVARTLSTLPTPPEPKPDQGRSQLAAGHIYRACLAIWDRCRGRRNVREATVVACRQGGPSARRQAAAAEDPAVALLDDALVLRASAAFETAAPWRDGWPAILAELLIGR